jgi:hypothetical protein
MALIEDNVRDTGRTYNIHSEELGISNVTRYELQYNNCLRTSYSLLA